MMKTYLSSIVLLVGLFAALPSFAQSEPRTPFFFNEDERMPLPSIGRPDRLRFVTTLDYPPFNSLNPQGLLSGYNIDLAKALCAQMGLEDLCLIEAVPWSELEERLEKGEADAIIAGLGPNSNNRTKLAFTRPYLRLPARFVTLKSNIFNESAARAVSGKEIGVIENTAHEQLLKAYFPYAKAKGFADRAKLLAALQQGKIEAAFDDGLTLSFWLQSDEGAKCCAFTDGPYIAPQYLGSGLTIATRNEQASLVDAFDAALQALQKKGTLTELYLRYFPISFY